MRDRARLIKHLSYLSNHAFEWIQKRTRAPIKIPERRLNDKHNQETQSFSRKITAMHLCERPTRQPCLQYNINACKAAVCNGTLYGMMETLQAKTNDFE